MESDRAMCTGTARSLLGCAEDCSLHSLN
jgi:hypothetical protein